MRSNTKLPIQIPQMANKGGHYFSIRLKDTLLAERTFYQRPDKLVVISDIEGNFAAFRKILITTKVINKKNQWTFSDGHLVIVGNCFDRGSQVIECLWMVYYLEEKARKEGGYVHFILGNHEIMNLNGDWRYKHPKYASDLRKEGKLYMTLYDGNSEIWRWIKTKNIVEKIGELLFVHGGISRSLLQYGYSLETINSRTRQNITDANNAFEDSFLKILFDENLSPFLYRGYYEDEENNDLISDTLSFYEAERIITGHIAAEEIKAYSNNRVINVDTSHANGNFQALLILKNNFYRVSLNGKRERVI